MSSADSHDQMDFARGLIEMEAKVLRNEKFKGLPQSTV